VCVLDMQGKLHRGREASNYRGNDEQEIVSARLYPLTAMMTQPVPEPRFLFMSQPSEGDCPVLNGGVLGSDALRQDM
jgi:hypothetical protein